eukprot:4027784-Amphidinium_carterae.1
MQLTSDLMTAVAEFEGSTNDEQEMVKVEGAEGKLFTLMRLTKQATHALKQPPSAWEHALIE